jgi:hypothetical protein
MSCSHTQPFAGSVTRRLAPLAAALAIMAGAGPAEAQQLFAPNALIGGIDQSALYTKYTRWALSFSNADGLFTDPDGAIATAAGNQGPLFFLAGSGDGTPVVRNVTLRSDQTVVISPVSVFYIEDPVNNTEAIMRADAEFVLGIVTDLSVSINGAPALLPGGVTLDDYRLFSTFGPRTLGPDNLFGVPPADYLGITYGYLMALQALPVGQHVLRFTALSTSTGPYAGSSFYQDITYNINSISAVPEASTWAMMSLGLAVLAGGSMRRRRG